VQGSAFVPRSRDYGATGRLEGCDPSKARPHGLDPLWITCDPANSASQRTINLVGARFVEIVDLPPDCVIYRDGKRRKMRFVLPL
jgi:predicted acetyltransferase